MGHKITSDAVVMTRNIYSFMNRGVCLHTESSTKICLQFQMNSASEHLEKRQVSQTDFANTLVCTMMKEYKLIWWSSPTMLILILGSLMKQLLPVKYILSIQGSHISCHWKIYQQWAVLLISMVKAGTQARFPDISTKKTTLQINKKMFPWLLSKQFEKAYISLSAMKKINWQQRKGKESYSPLNVICPPLNLKKHQFASNMLQCSKIISTCLL